MTSTDPDLRRWPRWVPWLAALLLVGLALALVPPGTLPYPPGSDTSDAALAHWPAADFLRESVYRYGQWPLWSPLRMLGQPFAANPLNKVWYPPQWLVLIFPPTLHLNLLIYGHLALLALGTFAWARREGLHPLAGLFGAAAWGLAPKLMAHLGAGHLDIVYALAWVPWLWWALPFPEQDGRPPVAAAIRVGVVSALLALADLRVAFYILPMWAVVGITRWLAGESERGWRSGLLVGGVGGTVFLLLTAVATLPLAALSSSLTRSAITAQDAAVFSLPPAYLLGLLIPDLGGFHEWMTYLGLPVIVLALVGLTKPGRRSEKGALAGLALLASLWALGENGPLFLPVARLLPIVSWVRVPSRAWFIVGWALVVLAVTGVDAVARVGLRQRGQLAALGLGVAGLVFLLAGWLMLPEVPTIAGAGAALLGTGIGLWLLGGGLAALAQRRVLVGGGLLLATLVVSLGWVAATLVSSRPLSVSMADDRRILAALDSPYCDPVYSPSFDLIGPAAAQAGIPTLHGVDPFQLAWSAQTIAAAAGVESAGYSVVAPPLPEDAPDFTTALSEVTPDADRLAGLGIVWVAARFPIETAGLTLHRQLDDLYVYRSTGGRPVTVPVAGADGPLEATEQILHRTCDQPPNVALDATFDSLPGGGAESVMVVLGQAWAPGWVATVDGQRAPVRRVGGMLAGVEVPALGEHRVRVVYRPAVDLIGAAISGVTALGLIGWWLLNRRRGGTHGEAR